MLFVLHYFVVSTSPNLPTIRIKIQDKVIKVLTNCNLDSKKCTPVDV